MSYLGQVRRSDFEGSQDDFKGLVAELSPGFRLLVDLTGLESMNLDCLDAIGEFMRIMDQSGVGMVVRVVPDPKKDIGLNILTLFHYQKRPQVITCRTLAEAAMLLSP